MLVKPMGPPPLEPIQDAPARPAQGRHVFGQQHHAEREHPEAEHGEDAQDSAANQQQASRDAQPARGWAPQPPRDRLCAARQAVYQEIEPLLVMLLLGGFARGLDDFGHVADAANMDVSSNDASVTIDDERCASYRG